MRTPADTDRSHITAARLRPARAGDAHELRALARRVGEVELRGPVVLATRDGRVVAARCVRDGVLYTDRDAPAEVPAALDAHARRAARGRLRRLVGA